MKLHRRERRKFQSLIGNLEQQNIKDGKEIHQRHLDIIDTKLNEQDDERISSMSKSWKNIGYFDDEIQLLIKAHNLISDHKNRKQNKKDASALIKKARESKNKRLND